MKWNNNELTYLKENYALLGSDISNTINRTKKSISQKAFELGLKADRKLVNEKISTIKLKNHKEFSDFKINPEQFLNITTPEIAYILGFLWADGYIRKDVIILWLKRTDAENIKHIFDKIGKWNIYYRYKNNKYRKEQMCFLTNNRFIYDFLVENDYKEKSLKSPDKILSLIPDNLKHYFYRGYFDGDGSIYKYDKYYQIGLNICSTYNQDWNFMIKLFDTLKINVTIKQNKYLTKDNKENKLSRLTILNKKEVILFCDYIYQDFDNIALIRKYNIYKQIKYNFLLLDDIRNSNDVYNYTKNKVYLDNDWVIVRSYKEFIKYIEKLKNLENLTISLDHDLGLTENKIEKNGYDCVKWLCNYCQDNNIKFPKYYIHSMNDVGALNMLSYINNYIKCVEQN